MKNAERNREIIIFVIDQVMKFITVAAVVAIGGSIIAMVKAMAINTMSINIIIAASIWLIIYTIYAYFADILDII